MHLRVDQYGQDDEHAYPLPPDGLHDPPRAHCLTHSTGLQQESLPRCPLWIAVLFRNAQILRKSMQFPIAQLKHNLRQECADSSPLRTASAPGGNLAAAGMTGVHLANNEFRSGGQSGSAGSRLPHSGGVPRPPCPMRAQLTEVSPMCWTRRPYCRPVDGVI